jgi:hypothetical protein
MAMTCAHCRSADVGALFSTWVCFSCGRHTTDDGRKILPDSLTYDPSHDPTLEAWGWPYDDVETSIARGEVCCAEQWGVPMQREDYAI